MFAGLNAACVGAFGEPVDYTIMSTGTIVSGVVVIPEMDTDEEQHHDAIYMRLFARVSDLGAKPEHGDVVSVAANATPLNAIGEARALPLGSSWTVFEALVDPVGGAYMRIRQDS